MFSKDLEHTISQSYKKARERRHEFMTVEHLFLALLDNPSAVNVLTSCGSDLDGLRSELEDIIDQTDHEDTVKQQHGSTDHVTHGIQIHRHRQPDKACTYRRDQ